MDGRGCLLRAKLEAALALKLEAEATFPSAFHVAQMEI
jgi:hypothetical protein